MPERHFGLARAEDLTALSGLEFLRAMINGEQPAPLMSATLGFRLVEVGEGGNRGAGDAWRAAGGCSRPPFPRCTCSPLSLAR